MYELETTPYCYGEEGEKERGGMYIPSYQDSDPVEEEMTS
jgi:hypothetical protein